MIKSSDETENKIKAAAREIFLEKGKDGARMRAIAERAGVNKALVHYYFRSKEKLYLAVLKDILKEVIARLVNIPEDIPFREFLEQFISSHIDFLNQHKKLLNFILWELREKKDAMQDFVEDVVGNFESVPREVFLKRIHNAIQNKEIKPINPLHFMLNLVSLDIFPFVASPIITSIFELSEDELATILNERKQEIFRLVWNDINNE
ncbi:MAG: TetR/AcrR family transcriptional regulator [Calditrichaeota bacterium]|nr:TetR/AcrR family transcriptional regulator [Calditrichota bacterium]